MSYAVDITPEAERQLFDLPLHIAEFVAEQISLLGESPLKLSKPAHFPYPLSGQSFEFDYEADDAHLHFYVMFKFAQDEQTLHIIFIHAQKIR